MLLQKIINLFKRIVTPKKSKYGDKEIINETHKTIILCKKCKQKLRVPVLQNKIFKVTCKKCGNDFSFDCGKYLYYQKLKILPIKLKCPSYFSSSSLPPFGSPLFPAPVT